MNDDQPLYTQRDEWTLVPGGMLGWVPVRYTDLGFEPPERHWFAPIGDEL